MDANRLKDVALFSDLSDDDREQISRWTDEVEVETGRHLAEQGEYAYEFFVIEDGTAEVMRNGEKIREMGPGDFFGEIALMETDRRTATVTATTPMRLIVMHGRDFREMASEIPHLAKHFQDAMAEREGR